MLITFCDSTKALPIELFELILFVISFLIYLDDILR